MTTYSIPLRLKRLRQTPATRALLQETRLHSDQFIAPLFIAEGLAKKQAIKSMPGQYQLGLGDLDAELNELKSLGIKAVLLFGIPLSKDSTGCSALSNDGIIQKAIRVIKEIDASMLVITDLCFCEYTDHGHCGIIDLDRIDNDSTLSQLAQQAISHAKAGADWIAPSGMMDGGVKAIRNALDKAGYQNTAILSYAVKYCSNYYGPFREAAQGAPQFGDRKDYQMNPGNGCEALREAKLDIEEGADLIMVKPALSYLDILFRLKQTYPEIPLCAYQVSGEYSMIKFSAQQGIINETAVMVESLLSIKRAGADLIISYFAKDIATWLKNN